MSVKAILVLCAQALLLKSALGQSCTSRAAVADAPVLSAPCGWAAPALTAPCGLAAPAWSYDGLAYDRMYAPAMEIIPTSGGGLPVSSYSAMAPAGISIASDNTFKGTLAVDGELPFVSAVALEGAVPSGGAGAVSYSCGNGRTAMISETAAFTPAATMAPLAAYGAGAAFAPAGLAAPSLGLRGGWAGRGCGCGFAAPAPKFDC
ncbi:hypothetical protein PYW08_011345 [Mythimna loreyi]|uniref:Uncharacterized protein n=1 Tax=Mythimna loreyi TaxID=667449 RepID=A0ACC2Q3A7_9NEOP|nr:hypothetical protein PYW08_011345 [Mythimna loreyi]